MKFMCHRCLLILVCCVPSICIAQWDVITHTDTDSDAKTPVAVIENNDGFSLEIYRDDVNAVRSRFSVSKAIDLLSDRECPTYQIDTRLLQNRSINDAPCLSDGVWAEYVLGYVDNNIITSSILNAFMNGTMITFRYELDYGGYRETSFSLAGSKRALTAAIGENIQVLPQ